MDVVMDRYLGERIRGGCTGGTGENVSIGGSVHVLDEATRVRQGSINVGHYLLGNLAWPNASMEP